MDREHARIPMQKRSRESFDRVIDAAIELLRQGGIQSLTLAEVSRRSKVSIGSIYCRVDSKSDLIRAVQARVLDDMDREFSRMVNRIRRRGLSLRELVPTLVREQGSFLRRHVALLNAFIEESVNDAYMATIGKRYHAQTALDFKLLLLERQADFVHADSERAADTCFSIVYGTLARAIGLGHSRDEGPDEKQWRRLVDDVGWAILAFLTVDVQQEPAAGKKGSLD